jgi:hypothetical protein
MHSAAWSQAPSQLQIDSTVVEKRAFEEGFRDRYASEAFQYDQLEGEAQNLLARFLRWVLNGLGDVLGFEVNPATIEAVKLLVYGVFILLAIYLIVRLLVGQRATSFFSPKGSKVAPLAFSEEEITTIDLDAHVQQALAQGDYRLALRYLYLKALRQLSHHNIIHWDPDKTNSDYLREITASELKEPFIRISYLYDYVWYGEFPLEKQGYVTAQGYFEQLSKQLTHVR